MAFGPQKSHGVFDKLDLLGGFPAESKTGAPAGLHYNEMDELTRDFEAFAERYPTIRDQTGARFVWRESTPQHFLSSTGNGVCCNESSRQLKLPAAPPIEPLDA